MAQSIKYGHKHKWVSFMKGTKANRRSLGTV